MPEFAERMNTMADTAAIVRNLFNTMTDAECISFSAGSPAKEALPVDIIREILDDVFYMDKRGAEALQYSNPQGIKDLRDVVVKYLLSPKGVSVSPDQILIGNGGLEAMNLLCEIFINPGDVILVESPTFVHCVEIFRMFQATCIACEMDDDGLIMDDVEAKIKQYHPKFVYTIPTFQNPTGKTMSLERRRKLAELGSEYDVIILEDDPYRDIRYSGVELPPIKAFDQTGNTVLANSFSKIFSPGSRLGYVAASPEIICKLFDAKTATNSHTSTLSQVICAEFFNRGYYPEHLKKICAIHRERRDAMMACIDEFFPEGTTHTFPDGGLFSWVELPDSIDTTALLAEANARHVSYVAGAGFFVEGGGKGKNCMRVSFSTVPPEKIRIGIARLGNLIKERL